MCLRITQYCFLTLAWQLIHSRNICGNPACTFDTERFTRPYYCILLYEPHFSSQPRLSILKRFDAFKNPHFKKILILFMNIFSCLSVKAVKWGFRSPVVGFIGACPWVKNCPARHPSTLPNGQNRHWNRKERKRLSQPTPLSWPLANEQSSSSSHFYPFFSLSWREALRPKFMLPL